MSNLICNAPFCSNIRNKKHGYCSFHRWEREKFNIKKYKELLPLWCKKKCNKHGYLRNEQTTYHKSSKLYLCKICIKEKPYDKEKQRESNKKHYHSRKNNRLKKRYGLNIKTYEEMLFEQSNKCAICEISIFDHQKLKGENKSFAVDHCHVTNKIRGLLCYRCNMGLGYFQDNSDFTQKATNYLIKFNSY